MGLLQIDHSAAILGCLEFWGLFRGYINARALRGGVSCWLSLVVVGCHWLLLVAVAWLLVEVC